jgi:hypothetical protein
MINIGTGTVPPHADTDLLKKRPWWTKIIPNAILKFVSLISDLAEMATASEVVAERMYRVSKDHPQDLFFKRFSATGIQDIHLDEWKATRPAVIDGLSSIEEKTLLYLADPDIRAEMHVTAKKLVEVYTQRQQQLRTMSTTSTKTCKTIDLSLTVVVNGIASDQPQVKLAAATDPEIPTLTTASNTDSIDSLPPSTPEPPLMTSGITTLIDEHEEALQSQGQQFSSARDLGLSATRLRGNTTKRAVSRNRAHTLPALGHEFNEE